MSDVLRALTYLRVTSFRNALRSRVQRLKQPKYLAGAVVGIAYLYFVFFRRGGGRDASARLKSVISIAQQSNVVTLSALLLMIFVALYWIVPRSRTALTFSEAEIAFLFPAPVRRSVLIHYRLINLQLRLVITALILGAISGGWGIFRGGVAIRTFGLWIVFAIMALHSIASSFAITRLLDRGVTSRCRQLVTICVITIMIAAGWLWIRREWRAPAPEDLANGNSVTSYLATMFSVAPLSWLVLPAKWVIQPALAADWRSFFASLGPALLVYAAHYTWVLRAQISFEDASIAKAEKRAAQLAAMRSGKPVALSRKARPPPFDLARVRRPEIAFLWKNLLASPKYLSLRNALIAAAIIIMGGNWLMSTNYDVLQSAIAVLSLVFAGYVLVIGPVASRQDLRGDLQNVDILKTYPLRGWQIVLGEILTPVAIVTVMFWVMLLAALTMMMSLPVPLPAWAINWRIPATIAIALLSPLLCAIQALVMNAMTVLFPAWMPSQGRAAGIEVMGQRILIIAGLFIVIVLALLPATVIAGTMFFTTQRFVGASIAAALSMIAVFASLIIEIALGVAWLGARFEHFDLSTELRV